MHIFTLPNPRVYSECPKDPSWSSISAPGDGVSYKLPFLKDLALILGHLLATAGNLDGLALLHTANVDLVMLP